MSVRERATAFYMRNVRVIQYTAAVVQLVTVPLLVLSLVGQVQIFEPLRTFVVVPLALVETFTVATLLVTGYSGPRVGIPRCHWCGANTVVPEVSAWRCTQCGRIDRGEAKANP